MKRGHVILISGAALLKAGIALSVVWGVSFASSFMMDSTVFDRKALGPGQSVEATRNVDDANKPLFLAIGVDPQQAQQDVVFRLKETVMDPAGKVISSNEFGESFTTTIQPEVKGVHTVTVTNLGEEPVTIGGAFGRVPFLGSDGKPNLDDMISSGGLGTIIAGGGLATVGIIVLIVGAVVTVIDSRKRQGTTTTTSEGRITYRKD